MKLLTTGEKISGFEGSFSMKDFNQLISTIAEIHTQLQAAAVQAVNRRLTVRNWLIGYYIVEFEQNGKDRAEYGERLIDNIADQFNPNYAIGGAISSELFALVGITPIPALSEAEV